jgi:hypothetical protein
MALSDVPLSHRNRIKQELVEAGATRYSLVKMESRYLPEIINQDEHINAAIYGLRGNFSGLLVATNHRIIYTERKPFYKVFDEISYPMVSGVGYNMRGPRASVKLHTRVGDYELRYVNNRSAEKFVRFIDSEHVKKLANS